MVQALLWVLLAPTLDVSPLSLANSDAPPPPIEDTARALAADVICGEAGNDEVLSSLVANVIINRMDRRGGPRATKIISILSAPRQFNGRCSNRGREAGDWHRWLAGVLVTGDLDQIRRGRPRWLTDKVVEFTETRGECAFAKAKKGRACGQWRRGRKLVFRYTGPRPRHGQPARMSFFANP